MVEFIVTVIDVKYNLKYPSSRIFYLIEKILNNFKMYIVDSSMYKIKRFYFSRINCCISHTSHISSITYPSVDRLC